jgi:hypothetical protein
MQSRARTRFDTPLDPEEVPAFHAARILLLLRYCGRGPRRTIRGRTKLAKLDFFVRYPQFLSRAAAELQPDSDVDRVADAESVEARMIRYRFGPWDHRYYNILAALEARGLVRVSRAQSYDAFELTSAGQQAVEQLAQDRSFFSVIERCRLTSELLGDMSGTQLKDFVYRNFVEEVARLSSESVIRQEPNR